MQFLGIFHPFNDVVEYAGEEFKFIYIKTDINAWILVIN